MSRRRDGHERPLLVPRDRRPARARCRRGRDRLLREHLGFTGVVPTDRPRHEGVANHWRPAQIAVMARAGRLATSCAFCRDTTRRSRESRSHPRGRGGRDPFKESEAAEKRIRALKVRLPRRLPAGPDPKEALRPPAASSTARSPTRSPGARGSRPDAMKPRALRPAISWQWRPRGAGRRRAARARRRRAAVASASRCASRRRPRPRRPSRRARPSDVSTSCTPCSPTTPCERSCARARRGPRSPPAAPRPRAGPRPPEGAARYSGRHPRSTSRSAGSAHEPARTDGGAELAAGDRATTARASARPHGRGRAWSSGPDDLVRARRHAEVSCAVAACRCSRLGRDAVGSRGVPRADDPVRRGRDEPPYRVDKDAAAARRLGRARRRRGRRARLDEGLRPGPGRRLHARGRRPGALLPLDVRWPSTSSSGHTTSPNVTLPLGVRALLVCRDDDARLAVLEPAVE